MNEMGVMRTSGRYLFSMAGRHIHGGYIIHEG